MSCYHPKRMLVLSDRNTGELVYKLIGEAVDTAASARLLPAPGCGRYDVVDVLNIPCRKCIGCRLDYSRDWANRMLLEYQNTKKAVFITLTYNDSHLPTSECGLPTLCKRDVQLWMKRLRKFFSGTQIRYFLAGEYGDQTHRPHYHAILFGLSIDDLVPLKIRNTNELGQSAYECCVLNDTWNLGFSSAAPTSYQTFSYVSRYCLKKQRLVDYTRDSLQLYEPEFSLMSRKPGLGGYYVTNDFLDGTNCVVSDGRETKSFPLSPALIRVLHDVDPQRYCELKEKRKRLADDRLQMELDHTSLSFLDYLHQREDSLIARTAKIRKKKDV